MELDQFIAQTLTQIANGINTANGNTRKNKNTPFALDCSSGAVYFDIAVTVENKGTASAKGKINVIAVSLDGDIDTTQKHEKVSRVQFRVTPNSARFDL